MPFALREMQPRLRDAGQWFARIVGSARFWAVLAVASLFFAIIAPFGMGVVPFGVRLSYWALTAVVTSIVAVGAISLTTAFLPRLSPPGQLIVGAVVSTFPNTVIVRWMIQWLIPGAPTLAYGTQFLTVLPVGLAMAGVMFFVLRDPEPEPEPATANTPSPLLERLPHEKRGPIVRLAVEDHYVRVHTVKGEELVLMRLGDAAAMMGERGMQVHRSHRVAFDRVRNARRANGRWLVTMSDGAEVPVSRTYIAAARERGLLG